MKPINLLMLDLCPNSNLRPDLRQIIEQSPDCELQLKEESLFSTETDLRSYDRMRDIICRIKPAVVLLISPRSALQMAKSLISSLCSSSYRAPLIFVTDENTPDELFDVMQLGVDDFITPPLTPMGILPRLWRLIHNRSQNPAPPVGDHKAWSLNGMLIGESPSFTRAVEKIPLIAGTDSTVLLSGETGTGKEVCARAIHQLSGRSKNRFMAVNCGAIPLDLVESELFGHEKGAFTSAVTAQPGLIREAEGGTLFLDELDSLPLLAQVKLLRFLQEKEFRPVGSTATRQADVRVIAATNIDVENAVRSGQIRQDLYYRLNMIPIAIPPLRERREDVPLLATHFLNRFAAKLGKKIAGFSNQTIEKLCLYQWPGNVRELECLIGRAVTFTENTIIQPDEITLPVSTPKSFQEAKRELIVQFERTYIQSLLIAYGGNITKAANAARKNRRSFFELIRKLGIDVDRFRR